MTYEQSIKYLESLIPINFNQELDPIVSACKLFDNPSFAFPSVHIAGTNGKGSTATFLASILMKSGYKVGLYTSPHLLDIRERIQVNRKPILKKDFVKLTNYIKENLTSEKSITYFELLTLMAFVYFRDQKVDIAVVETGLGGRLDATNIINSQVAIITSISYDHKRHLGSTLTDIAKEKCGIIKRGVPTVVAHQPKEVMNVIRSYCDELGSPLCIADVDQINMPLGLAGDHQKQNASCAIEAANLLQSSKFKISNIEKALLNTKWDARLEVISQKPKVILDGAHNPAGAKALADYISKEVKRENAVLMLGVMADKDIKNICRPLVPNVREVVCVKTPTQRTASPKDLAAAARSFGAVVHNEEEIGPALKKWLKKMGPNDTLIISGSLTLAGEVKKHFKNRK